MLVLSPLDGIGFGRCAWRVSPPAAREDFSAFPQVSRFGCIFLHALDCTFRHAGESIKRYLIMEMPMLKPSWKVFSWVLVFIHSAIVLAAPGDFDPSFGLSGKSFAGVNDADAAYGHAVAIQPDGKIVVVGRCTVLATLSVQMCAIRLLPNGFFDTAFGNNGSVLIGPDTPGPGYDEIAHAVALQSDGKIVLAGSCYSGGDPQHTCVVRLQTNGALDPSFGTNGKTRFTFGSGGTQEARSVVALADGRLLLGGRCRGDSLATVGVCVVRLLANGSVDTSFGLSGRSIASKALTEQLTSMLVLSDGRILIATAGNSSIPPSSADKVFVSQLTAQGAWNSSFGVSGTRELNLCGDNDKPRLALQADGKVIVSFVCDQTQRAVRLFADGSLDGLYQYVHTGLGVQGEYGIKPLVQADGRTLFTAAVLNVAPQPVTADFFAGRTFDTGAVDPTYSGGAKPMLSSGDYANDAALQPDGKLVIAGSCDSGTTSQICVARWLGDASTAARQCTMDIDGDGRVLATSDALILARVALGMRGGDVLSGLTTSGTRNTWPAIRDYLIYQCGMTGIAP